MPCFAERPMIGRLSEAISDALVCNNQNSIFHWKQLETSVVAVQNLQGIKNFLTLELRQQSKSGSTFS